MLKICNSILCSDYLFKLLLIGDSGVGKSSLLLRFSVSFISLFEINLVFDPFIYIFLGRISD